MATSATILVTGASGQLGRLVIAELRKIAPRATLLGLARDPAKAQDLVGPGVELRQGSYDDPAALEAAFAGVDRLLLISSSEVGRRATQHRNVVEAARVAGVSLVVYTSILHADRNPMFLAGEHKTTEEVLTASGLPFVLLRNGWYTENYLESISAALDFGVMQGAAGEGRIASAMRVDYASAAAAVISGDASMQAGKVYELAGDESYTRTHLAAEIAKQSGKHVVYDNLSEEAYRAALVQAGLPEALAGVLAESDAKAATGSLFDDSHTLSRLIGRPTTSLSAAVAAALAGNVR